jgi:hypothetical protein
MTKFGTRGAASACPERGSAAKTATAYLPAAVRTLGLRIGGPEAAFVMETRPPLPNPRNRLVAVRRQLWYLTARACPRGRVRGGRDQPSVDPTQ